MGNISSCEHYADRIIELVNKGYGYRTIAKEIGIHRNSIRSWLRKNNIKPQEQDQKLSEEEIIKRVAEHGFKYIGGYINNKSTIEIYCNKCGNTFKRNAGIFQNNYKFKAKCYSCMNVEAEEKKQIGKQSKFIAKQIEQIKANKQRQRNELIGRLVKQITKLHHCPVCNELTLRMEYCSINCRKRVYNKTKEVKRRFKINSVLIDKDITVKGLYKRDGGVCYICNQPTDMKDYKKIDKTIICGGSYPSIDHVIPLSKGGLHSWGNVKLAHRQCNWEKSDILL